MKIILDKLVIKNIDWTDMVEQDWTLTSDIFKWVIPDLIWKNAKNVGNVVVAQDLYKNKEAEVTEEQKKDIEDIFDKFDYPAIIKLAISEMFIN